MRGLCRSVCGCSFAVPSRAFGDTFSISCTGCRQRSPAIRIYTPHAVARDHRILGIRWRNQWAGSRDSSRRFCDRSAFVRQRRDGSRESRSGRLSAQDQLPGRRDDDSHDLRPSRAGSGGLHHRLIVSVRRTARIFVPPSGGSRASYESGTARLLTARPFPRIRFPALQTGPETLWPLPAGARCPNSWSSSTDARRKNSPECRTRKLRRRA